MTAIPILGEYTPVSAPQAATAVAIGHVQARLGVAVEAQHPFFLGTLLVPQRRSTPERPHPLVSTFVDVAVACTKVRNA